MQTNYEATSQHVNTANPPPPEQIFWPFFTPTAEAKRSAVRRNDIGSKFFRTEGNEVTEGPFAMQRLSPFFRTGGERSETEGPL